MGKKSRDEENRIVRHSKAKETVRPSVRLNKDTYQRVQYWADRKDITANDFIADAIEEKIARLSGDELAGADSELMSLLNQMIDRMGEIESSMNNFSSVQSNQTKLWTSMLRGNNYLLDDANDL